MSSEDRAGCLRLLWVFVPMALLGVALLILATVLGKPAQHYCAGLGLLLTAGGVLISGSMWAMACRHVEQDRKEQADEKV